MKTGEITFTIVKDLCVLSRNGKYTKEVNVLTFGRENEIRLDLRNWCVDDKTGQKMMLKGICLSLPEAVALHEALAKILESGELQALMQGQGQKEG